jgi:Ca2+-transporting ATPase
MVYSCSTVDYGAAGGGHRHGMETEMGKLPMRWHRRDQETPLQKKLSKLSVTLTKLVLAICVFVFAFGVVRDVFIVKSSASVFNVVLDTFYLPLPGGCGDS